jgi:hypothetical protein
MKDCYLVLTLDASDPTKPTVVGAGIYSEGWLGLTLPMKKDRSYADALKTSDKDYGVARKRLLQTIAGLMVYGTYEWVVPFLDKSDQEKIAAFRAELNA